MLVVIRNIDTGLFFRSENWTQFIKFAERFKDLREAATAALKHHLKHAEMVIVQGDSVVGGVPIEETP